MKTYEVLFAQDAFCVIRYSVCRVVLLWWEMGAEALGVLNYNDAPQMQICLVTGPTEVAANGGLRIKPNLTVLICIISLARHTNVCGVERLRRLAGVLS